MSDRARDRRHMRRHSATEAHGIVAARVRPGHRATLLDVSAGGALIETACRLLPGASVELHVETAQHRTCIRGRVLRCTVVGVDSTLICYRGAIRFEDRLPWLMTDTGNSVASRMEPERPRWAAATRQER
jgi:hypothetical protein